LVSGVGFESRNLEFDPQKTSKTVEPNSGFKNHYLRKVEKKEETSET
jgi:hypothetical protein